MEEKVDTSSESKNKKLELQYPCIWKYKLVTDKSDELENSICQMFSDKKHNLNFSNKSKKGKYKSYELSLSVESDEERKKIYNDLKKDKNIKAII